ncbi:MAG: hypothetical protein QOD91_2670 [Frankiales bacterium]|jgi:hypothetical protein|nr:hypothetical protein [Frankiales bacterium]
MNDRFQDTAQATEEPQQQPPLPPLPRDEVILPGGPGTGAQRELYGALMKGFGPDEQDDLEHMMIDNIERLREDGDSYAP